MHRAELLTAHLVADHGDLTPPDLTPRRWPFPPPTTVDDLEADRRADRLERIQEGRLP
jgi:hypothetical protein